MMEVKSEEAKRVVVGFGELLDERLESCAFLVEISEHCDRFDQSGSRSVNEQRGWSRERERERGV
jgi:hypothetical protein